MTTIRAGLLILKRIGKDWGNKIDQCLYYLIPLWGREQLKIPLIFPISWYSFNRYETRSSEYLNACRALQFLFCELRMSNKNIAGRKMTSNKDRSMDGGMGTQELDPSSRACTCALRRVIFFLIHGNESKRTRLEKRFVWEVPRLKWMRQRGVPPFYTHSARTWHLEGIGRRVLERPSKKRLYFIRMVSLSHWPEKESLRSGEIFRTERKWNVSFLFMPALFSFDIWRALKNKWCDLA